MGNISISEIYFENRHTWCISGLRVEHAPLVSWPPLVRANEWRACVKMSPVLRWTVLVLVLCALFLTIFADSKQKPKKKKDIRDYNDADMARLLEQWEVRSSGVFLWKWIHMSAAGLSSIKPFMLWISYIFTQNTSRVVTFCPQKGIYIPSWDDNLIAEVLETQITVGYSAVKLTHASLKLYILSVVLTLVL